MESLKLRCEKLESENYELRRQLSSAAKSSSSYKNKLELVVAEQDRLGRLVEQLKSEKAHLVENVIELSNEVDEIQRLRLDEQLKFKQEVLRYSELEKKSQASKFRVGMEIVEKLMILGVGRSVVQEVQAMVARQTSNHNGNNDSRSSSKGLTLNLTIDDPTLEGNIGVSGVSSGSSKGTTSESQLTSNTLEAFRQSPHPQIRKNNLPELDQLNLNEKTVSGRDRPMSPKSQRSSSQTSSRRSRTSRSSRRSSRRGDVLERDETESVISSVSTHRSRTSQSDGLKTDKKKKKTKGITAALLAELDKQNGASKARPPRDVKATPQINNHLETPKVVTEKTALENDRAWWNIF